MKHQCFGQKIYTESWLNQTCSGTCSGCGLTLQRGDLTLDQLEVLRLQVDAVFKKILLEESKNIQDERNKLDHLKEMVSTNDFGMIIDGMNVAHEGKKGLDRRLVSVIIHYSAVWGCLVVLLCLP